MKAPIVVDENGDVSVFETVEYAAAFLEAIDVANDEYVAYDSEGRLLALEVSSANQQVMIREAETVATHADDLRRTLRSFFSRTGVRDIASTVKVGELIARFVAEYGYTR